MSECVSLLPKHASEIGQTDVTNLTSRNSTPWYRHWFEARKQMLDQI